MKRSLVNLILTITVVACGASTEPATQPVATTMGSTSSPSNSEPFTTLPPIVGEWTVANLGQNPTLVGGPNGELGSGCAPGTDVLPDGVWFGWITGAGSDGVEFDLACLWPGRLWNAVSNDSSQIRTVPIDSRSRIHLDSSTVTMSDWIQAGAVLDQVDNAPGLPPTTAVWLFINDGYLSEISLYPEAVKWAIVANSWPPIQTGCCGEGDIAPPSPTGAWPASGWPADGLYPMSISPEQRGWPDPASGQFSLTIRKWARCTDNPGLCMEDWVGDEVIEVGSALIRDVTFSGDMTVVIEPGPIVGDGVAFGEMLAVLLQDTATWMGPEGFPTSSSDPTFPFGVDPEMGGEGDDWFAAWRGPGGTYLHFYPRTFLEIRQGHPILYFQATWRP